MSPTRNRVSSQESREHAAEEFSLPLLAFCHRAAHASRALWTCCEDWLEDFRQNAPAVENQHRSSTNASSSAMTLELQPVLGANHGELGGREECCEALEQAY